MAASTSRVHFHQEVDVRLEFETRRITERLEGSRSLDQIPNFKVGDVTYLIKSQMELFYCQ